ncbi:unnamed protein product [Macrosiphum euphorbiae]|nr:unnamed protein product [Macrosiphum euphorbiae]
MDVYHKSYCAKIITAACCLHNICMTTGDDFDADPYVSEIEIGGDLHEDGTRSGVLKRNTICNALLLQDHI